MVGEPSDETGIWVKRTYGILPKGSEVKTEVVDTKTYIDYGERTWTTGQTIRDILQNHLDANTQRYFNQLVSTVIETANLDITKANAFDEFSYTLFRYRKALEDLSPEAEGEYIDLFNQYANELPLKPQYVNPDGTIKIESIKSAISTIEESPPLIRYRVVDQTQDASKQVSKWVDWQKMQSPEYLEQIKDSEGKKVFRYRITGVQILDEGSGFDSKLTGFYKSTKTGKRHLRGKFGEGLKMSEAHLIRNGAKVKMRSAYHINEGENRDRVWQQRPYVGDDGTVKIKSIEIDIPQEQKMQSGSFTIIDIQAAIPEFQEEFIKNIDPRISNQGLAINCLAYSKIKYFYPIVKIDNSTKPLGVSLDADPNYQYVQDLRVGEGQRKSDQVLLFSYNFLDSNILTGRDRSELNNAMYSQIKRFWQEAESPLLLKELIRRSLLEGRDSSGVSPEFNALKTLINSDPCDLNAQARRTRSTVLEIMPEVLGIERGRKNVVVSDLQLSNPNNQMLLRTLEKKGYHIVNIANIVVDANYQKINEHHQGELEVYTLESLRKDIDSLVGRLDINDEKVRFVDTLYQSARNDLEMMIEKAGLDPIDNFDRNPVYLETVDPKTELPVELVFDEELKIFRLKIRPDLILAGLKNGKGIDYWQRRIQVEMLAAFKRNTPFPDRNTALQASQKGAMELLDLTLHAGMSDVDALPKQFNHRVEDQNEGTSIALFTEELKDINESLLAMEMFDIARKFQSPLSDLKMVSHILPKLPKIYQENIKRMLLNRIIVENGTVGFFTEQYTPEGNKVVFIKKNIDDIPVVATLGERKVYRAGGKLFVLQEIPDGSVIKMDEHHTYVAYRGKMLDFGYPFGEYEFNSSPLTLGNGCLSVEMPDYIEDFSEALEKLKNGLSKLIISPPEKDERKEMKRLNGIIETSLPVEYGVDEWDNPIRVFEDIVQNHIDAAPDGKVDLEYEVVRDGKRIWITESSLTDSDKIVGLKIMDKGGGYLPEGLGTMGNSSKKSPMFAGKYGEGIKMVSAAALRNGFSISFNSLGNYEGEHYRWTALAVTKDEELYIEGKRSKAKRVVFDFNSKKVGKVENETVYTSATILSLPDENEYDNSEWQKWLEVFDPRKKDEKGNGGLSRYVINLRKEKNPNVIDFGYMQILLDEPGAVYENGLLVKRGANLVAGYNVPEVVSTRDRNSYDEGKLSNYIGCAMRDCRDPRYPLRILGYLKAHYLDQMIKNPEFTWIREKDLNFSYVFLFDRGFMSGKPWWRYAYAKEMAGYLVHSDEALRDKIEAGEASLKYGFDKKRYLEEIERARMTLANIDHFPKDRLIQLSKSSYDSWAMVFPTTEDYAMRLAEQKIPVGTNTMRQLTRIVAESSFIIRQMIAKMQQYEERKITYASIIIEKPPSEIDSYREEIAKEEISKYLGFWSNEEELLKQGAVFVAPANSLYLGIATRDKIGLNERLLVEKDLLLRIVATTRHELLHKIFGIRDYTPEFVMLLLELVKTNIEST